MNRKVIVFLLFICLIAAAVLAADVSRLVSLRGQTEVPAAETDAPLSSDAPVPDPTSEPVVKTIYLTFDDGPFKYTRRLLDILDEYDVKATFFVTDQNSEYTPLIRDEYEKGHAVGVHSACHKYKTLYRSDGYFLKDFYEMQRIIRDYTGGYTRLYRFPGGTSNTVSLKYSDGIVSRMAEFLDSNGYVYFDWNITSKDSEGLTTAEEIVSTTVEQIEELDETAYIVLQHDIYECSVEATEGIIKWGLENGYRFDKLSTDTPTVHFEVAN